jgi:predicted O-methyltransferase YrrM
MTTDSTEHTRPAPSRAELLASLTSTSPAFHSAGTRTWNALPATLELIADNTRPGARTLETGAGASTVVFAAAGAQHLAISPFADEHRRITDYCGSVGIDTAGLKFAVGPSDEILPGLDGPYDVVFIDGKHSFPDPVVDFHYCWKLLRVGGLLLLDDVPIPAVGVVHRFCAAAPEWEVVRLADNRAGAYRKLADQDAEDNWRRQPFNKRYPDFSFAGPVDRARLIAVERWPETKKTLARRLPWLADRIRRH